MARESQRWVFVSAFSLTLGTLLAVWLGTTVPLAIIATSSFGVFVARGHEEWTPQGNFGWPNAITSLRLLLSLGLLFAHAEQPGSVVVGVALANLLLDVADGWLARRSGSSSAFGARYDVETDALLVLALSLILLDRGIAGPWVLVAGLLRYVYVLAQVVFPSSRGEAPRSRHGRFFYVFMVVCFLLALVTPRDLGVLLVAAGTLGVSASFAHSFWWCYGPVRTEVSSKSKSTSGPMVK